MTDINLGYIGLSISDKSSWFRYAKDFLGVMEADQSPDGVDRLRIDDQEWRIALEAGDADDVAYLGFEVPDATELGAVGARLEKQGFSVKPGTVELRRERGVMDLLTSVTPDGLPIEIFYGPTVASHKPFVSPQGVTFVTGSQGLGHVALAVPASGIGEARRFYLDGLGFRQADIIRMAMGPEIAVDLEFYYGNPRHHTVALAPLPMASPKRLHHLMLQTETLDQVGFALDRANGADVRITQSLGRHSNDKMVSFYCATPSGFELEYGYGAIEIDEPEWRMARHDRISSWGHKRL